MRSSFWPSPLIGSPSLAFPPSAEVKAPAGRKKKIMSAINFSLALCKKYEHTHLYE